MTIKGTLETFNLRELLQMLAFNQKVGTLVLETERGQQTVYVDKGTVTFVEGDQAQDRALLRVIHRQGLVVADRLERAIQINETSGTHLGKVLREMGACEDEALDLAARVAAGERFLTLQLTSVSHFEFVDGSAVAPGGVVGEPIEPALVVDGLLLDLTRKMDQWAELARVVPGLGEIYETTGVSFDLDASLVESELDRSLTERVIAAYDGFRTLHHVVDVSFADELTVVEVTALLVEAGALRPVPTEDLLARGEDLLARGEARQALPLLRRAVEREDASSDVRLRLADALEGVGEKEAAATELDTYVALAENAQPRDIFDALHRALGLREGDATTAARLCDHFLRNRPWLEERREQALDALRHLIHGAVTSRRPMDAAERLAEFIHNGDSHSEDLLVLADLYASAGERTEAATALYRRAEDQLAAGRVVQGRELLERTVQLDPSRADARSRLHSLMGQDRRNRRKRRTVVFLVLMGLLLFGAGAAWWAYNQEANRAVRAVREQAEMTVNQAESEAYELLDAFDARLAKAMDSDTPDEGLESAANGMINDVQTALGKADAAIYAFAAELERYQSTEHEHAHTYMLRTLEKRREDVLRRAVNTVKAAKARGQTALVSGEEALRVGRHAEARGLLRTARNLAFDDPAIATRATVLLRHVEDYLVKFEAAFAKFEAARQAGQIEQTFRLGCGILTEMFDSTSTRRVLLPVRIASVPAGARIRLAGQSGDVRTPTVLEYSPFEPTDVVLWLPGRVPEKVHLPSYADLLNEPATWESWEPKVAVDLPAGASWTISAKQGPYAALWMSAGVPVMATTNGDAIQTVEVESGRAGARIAVRQPNPVRTGGTLAGKVEWRIMGSRTLAVRAPDGEAWETQVLGHLSRAPILVSGVLIVVDELGTVYGIDLRAGEEKWRQVLEAAPCHGPHLSKLGVLVSTYTGGLFVLDPGTGHRREVPLDARGLTLALPAGDGVVVLGGAIGAIRRIEANGTVRRLGNARPSEGIDPWVSPAGVAWVEEGRVRWLAVDADAPVALTGLGTDVVGLAGDGPTVYAATANGAVRAVSVEAPGTRLWDAVVGRQITGSPTPVGDYLLVLVDGGLAAIAR